MSLEQTKPRSFGAVTGGRLGAAPSSRRLGAWLTAPTLRCPDGQILSWCNPAHPGYPYPEATAIWLSWAAWRHETGQRGPERSAVRQTAAWLLREIEERGSLGRGEARYLFDSGLALHALARAARIPGWVEADTARLGALSAGLLRFLEEDSPVLPLPADASRWSHRWSGHLLRAASLVLLAGVWLDHRPTERIAQRVIERVERCDPHRPCYLHALAYQAEGELLLASLGQREEHGRALATAEHLALLQRADGLLPAWSHRPHSRRCDTTAQALRLWCALDPARYAGRIEAAVAALGRSQDPSGGIPYEPGSRDLNSWVSLFADQALHWAHTAPAPRALL